MIVLNTLALAVLGVAGAAYLLRARSAALAQSFERRLPVGVDGIIPGAQALRVEGSPDGAVLLLHGFGDTPRTLEYLAHALGDAGYTVFAPLLPGHGRTLASFNGTRAKEWISAAREAYAELRGTHPSVAVMGLSMGGALGIILAADEPGLPALALVAPYVSMPRRARTVARLHRAWELFTPVFRSGGQRSIHDPVERARSLAYGLVTPGTLFELSRVVRRVQVSLPRIKAPTLVIHGVHDERVPPDAAAREFARLGAPEKELVWADQGGHVLTVDVGRERIIELVVGWITRHAPLRAAREARKAPQTD
jgi:carboxylesterase